MGYESYEVEKWVLSTETIGFKDMMASFQVRDFFQVRLLQVGPSSPYFWIACKINMCIHKIYLYNMYIYIYTQNHSGQRH